MRRCLTIVLLFAATLAAQATAPLDPVAMRGTRILAGGGKLPPEIFARFHELAGGAKAKRCPAVALESLHVGCVRDRGLGGALHVATLPGAWNPSPAWLGRGTVRR